MAPLVSLLSGFDCTMYFKGHSKQWKRKIVCTWYALIKECVNYSDRHILHVIRSSLFKNCSSNRFGMMVTFFTVTIFKWIFFKGMQTALAYWIRLHFKQTIGDIDLISGAVNTAIYACALDAVVHEPRLLVFFYFTTAIHTNWLL